MLKVGKPSKKEKDKAISLFEKGELIQSIAKKLKRSEETVKSWILEYKQDRSFLENLISHVKDSIFVKLSLIVFLVVSIGAICCVFGIKRINISKAQKLYREKGFEWLLNSENGEKKVIDLLQKGLISPIDYEADGKTVLMSAAKNCANVEILDLLLKKTQDINQFNEKGQNAVMFAARYNTNPAILALLVERGGNLKGNSSGFSLTMLAACNPNPVILSIVPKVTSNMNCKTILGKTALMYACETNQSVEKIEILILDFGEDVNAVDDEGKTALMYSAANCEDLSIVKYLISRGADLNIQDLEGNTVSTYLLQNPKIIGIDLSDYISK